MRLLVLLSFLLSSGCASSQKNVQDHSEWNILVLDGYELTAEEINGRLQVDTVKGKNTVYIFERTVGRMEVDAGYMERLWLQAGKTKQALKIPSEGIGYYEQLCRCQYAGFHKILEGELNWSEKKGDIQVNGYVHLKDRQVKW